MKNHFRLFALISILSLFALTLPFALSAQNDEDLETLTVGNTVKGVSRGAEYLLDAQEGQTVTLRWDGDLDIYANCPDKPFISIIDVKTKLTNADEETLPQIDLLYLTDATIEVYALEGTPPYRLSSTICGGEGMTLTVLEGNTISHNEQSALSIGETLRIAGSSIQEEELVVIPLNVKEGDVFTVNTHYLNSTLLTDYPLYFAVVRDGNGQLVPSDFSGRFGDAWTQFPVYTVTGALPYRLDFAALFPEFSGYTPTHGEITSDISFSAELLAGNTVIEDGGLVELGSRLDVTLPDLDSARFYTLEVEDGDIVTFHDEFAMTSMLYMSFWDGNGDYVNDPISFYAPNSQNGISVGVAVYQLEGPQPYTLLFTGQGNYTLVVDAGDTLERRELGRLAPGGVIQGIKPPFDDVMDFVTLDVDPEATVTLNWNDPETGYNIVDGEGNFMDFQNSYTDGYGIVNLSRGTPPFIVRIDEPAGQRYTLTLAEGTVPLSPDDATTSGNAETATQGGTLSETVPNASTIFCRISGNSDVNQRTGPGTDYDLAGQLTAGSNADVNGQATGADGLVWWRLGEGVWVRSDVVDEAGDCEAVPFVTP
jgi:hypothetical protein